MRKIFLATLILICSFILKAQAQSPVPTMVFATTTAMTNYTGTNTLAMVQDTSTLMAGSYYYTTAGLTNNGYTIISSAKGGHWVMYGNRVSHYNSSKSNTVVGYQGLANGDVASRYSIAIGDNSLKDAQGDYNNGLGYGALQSTVGSKNVGIGSFAQTVSDGSNNTTVGYFAPLFGMGSGNTGIGSSIGFGAQSGDTANIPVTTVTLASTTLVGTSIATFITAHSLVLNSFYGVKMVFYNTPPSAGSALETTVYYKAQMTASNTLRLTALSNFTSQGTGTFQLTLYTTVNNATAIGYQAVATRTNQEAHSPYTDTILYPGLVTSAGRVLTDVAGNGKLTLEAAAGQRFGIEDNLGVQDRSVDHQGFGMEQNNANYLYYDIKNGKAGFGVNRDDDATGGYYAYRVQDTVSGYYDAFDIYNIGAYFEQLRAGNGGQYKRLIVPDLTTHPISNYIPVTVNGNYANSAGEISLGSGSGFWDLNTGGAMTGVNTLTSLQRNAWLWNNTFTGNAGGQYMHSFNHNYTFRATTGDTAYGLKVWGNYTKAANTQHVVLLDLEPNRISGGFTGGVFDALQVGGDINPKATNTQNVGTRSDLGRYFAGGGFNFMYAANYNPLTPGSPVKWLNGGAVNLMQLYNGTENNTPGSYAGTTLEISSHTQFTGSATGYRLNAKGEGKFLGSLTLAGISNPSGSVANVGTAGGTTYTYVIVGHTVSGSTTAKSANITTLTGNATLSGGNFNRLTITEVVGCISYDIYRTVGGATQGLIGVLNVGSFSAFTFDDTNKTGDGLTAPTINTTGNLLLSSYGTSLHTGTPTTYAAFDVSGNVIEVTGAGTGFVPYTGATSDVDLGSQNLITGGYLQGNYRSTGSTSIKFNNSTGTELFRGSNSTGFLANLDFGSLTDNRTYTYQDGDGTLAFLSDIPLVSGYVPYTGATSDVDLGSHNVTTSGHYSGTYWSSDPSLFDFKNSSGTTLSRFGNSSGFRADLIFNSITATRTYTFQDADGTIAFLSDVALKSNIASPTFTGTVTIPNGGVFNTPTSITLTNGIGLPISTGVSGLGTGVATALGVNVGSAGAFVTFNGALGTPSSGTVTNLTGTASININGTVSGNTFTTGTYTLTGTAGKTLTFSNSITLAGTDATTMTFPSVSASIPGLAVANIFTALQTNRLVTKQLSLEYDASNTAGFTVSSIGSLTIDLVGTSPIVTLSQNVVLGGGFQMAATATNSNLSVPTVSSAATTSSNANMIFGANTVVNYRRLSRGSTNTTLPVGNGYGGTIFGIENITEAASGTHPLLASVVINPIAITNGSATTTDLTSFYIGGAPTGITPTNTATAMWVASGVVKFDGGILGTTTNNAAAAGNVGEEINSTISTYTNYTTTATYQNVTSIALTAGDWDISAFYTYSSNSATITAASNAIFVISTTTASAAGATEGQNISYVPQAALLGTSKFSDAITPYRVSLSGTTTYYLNTQATFTLGNPQYVGSIRARRIR